MRYAEIIVDISTQALDHIFTYAIPEELFSEVHVGCRVVIPFGRGNQERQGYVMRIKNEAQYDEDKIKPVLRVLVDADLVEEQLIKLAYWIKEQYGSTLIQALMTVLPVKAKSTGKEVRYLHLQIDDKQAQKLCSEYERKHYVGKLRLLEAMIKDKVVSKTLVMHSLHIADSTIKAMLRDGIIVERSVRTYRNPSTGETAALPIHRLNEEQQAAYETFRQDYEAGIRKTYLLYGVTGSGKTEVYLEMIEQVLSAGRQAIVLIPEIALTYQTVRRFASRFGEQVTVIHSRLSKGERYDQFERARKGEVKVVIGPRSALFVPFAHLGLIIIDEEHETSYKSESPPKYHARETAMERARLAGASVVLGSATPSVESFFRAEEGQYQLLPMRKRVAGAVLPEVRVIDMRKELEAKNFSMFSHELHSLLRDRLAKGEQSILFINRRGYASFVSCRKCGYVVKCFHCDVSLKLHGKSRLVCHYCGHEETMPALCPECGSHYIRSFGTGTQKVEEQLKKEFPTARILRMDADTTKGKGGHERLLTAFANQEADILIGTQMIVKGHDFPNVTLVGALAADMSLFEQDFRSSERTFDLLTQAAGRAGRGKKAGQMVIQTYRPEQYSIAAAAAQDYEMFYKEEMAYRKLLSYPPKAHMLAIFMASEKQEKVEAHAAQLAAFIKPLCTVEDKEHCLKLIGPSEAGIYKVQDVYRKLLYIKGVFYEDLVTVKNRVEQYCMEQEIVKDTRVYFDFDPMTMY